MDTLAITDKLIASGTPEPQARAQAQIHEEKSRETKAAVKEEVAKAAEGFVTRAELFNAISEFRREMSELRKEISALREDNARLRQEMADRDTQMTRFTVGAMMGGMTVMTAIFGVIVALAIQSLG